METTQESLFKTPVPFTANFELENIHLTKGEPPDDIPTEDTSGNRVVEGYASTGDLDAQRHIITEDAIKQGATSLGEYRTVLFNHDPNRPIGKLVAVEPRDNRLWIKVIISKSEPLIWEKIKDGTLSKFSVKGKILGAEKQLQSSEDGTPDPSKEILIIKSMELYEVSLVSVPANSKARSLVWYIEKALDGNPELQSQSEEVELNAKEEDTSAEDIEKLKEEYPWLGDVLKDIDEHPENYEGVDTIELGLPEEENLEEQEDIPEVIDLEKFVEENIPYNVPLDQFELIKELVLASFEEALEKGVVGKLAASAGRWITTGTGKKIFIRAAKGAAKGASRAGKALVNTFNRGNAKQAIRDLGRTSGLAAIYGATEGGRKVAQAKKVKKDAEEVDQPDEFITLIQEAQEIFKQYINCTDLETWVEERLPIELSLDQFEFTKAATIEFVTTVLDDVFEKAGNSDAKSVKGRWITYMGRRIFIPMAGLAAGAAVGALAGGAIGGAAAKGTSEFARDVARIASRHGMPAVHAGRAIGAIAGGVVGAASGSSYGTYRSIKPYVENPNAAPNKAGSGFLGTKKPKKVKKDADGGYSIVDNDDNMFDNDIDVTEIMKDIEDQLKGGELFVDIVKNVEAIDTAIKSLTETASALKGEDLDQVQAVLNSLKAMRIKLFGDEQKQEEQKAASLEPIKEEDKVQPAPKETDALADIVKQLQEVAKTVTEQAATVKTTLDEVNTAKTDITKAIEGITDVVSKIPIRKGQNPESEGVDRQIEKSLMETIKEKVGDEKFKRLHPGEKLHMIIKEKLNHQ